MAYNTSGKMTKWYCPKCGEANMDFCDDGTHCAHCGRVVWVLGVGQGVIDEKWSVELPPATPPPDAGG
jgi:ribosomal protein S27AE